MSGKSPSSKTIEGVLGIINERMDILDKEKVIEDFNQQALILIQRMEKDGYYFPKDKK